MQAVLECPSGRVDIVDTLHEMAKTKDLSYGERKMLDLAEHYEVRQAEAMRNVINLAERRLRKAKESGKIGLEAIQRSGNDGDDVA